MSGWIVGALGRTPKALEKLDHAQHKWQFDAYNVDSLSEVFDHVRADGFIPHAAVNAFGVTERAPFLLQTNDQWDRVLTINLKAVWRCVQLQAVLMQGNGGGSIVNLGSVASLRGNGWNEAPYVASKHGLLGLTKAAALELAASNIRVNMVCPSMLEGGLTKGLSFGGKSLAEVTRKHPLGRLVRASDVANAALWLCGPGSEGVTGIALPVDAGLTAK
ncbi:MAG: hypothetical protein QOJ94_3040 [Sphingomonadales bacterium]|nr:hypothetical protein [Sphingomonadales bacterium]